MPDVHVICDAPVGCFNLVGTAVPDYTDAVPHIENLTPATMTEQEVGGAGTWKKVRDTFEGLRDSGVLEGKRVIVVSTAESEMIGSDHSALVGTLQPGTTFYYSNSLSEDEWAGRDRVLRWLWDNYSGDPAALPAVEPGTVNIIGPTYGCFNSPSDLHELRRLIEGAGGRINLVYPFEATLADTPRLASGQVNVVLYREFGAGLAERLGRPTLFAPFGIGETTEFIRSLGALLGTEAQAEAFIEREKRTTLQAIWDLWRGPQSDWFGTTDLAVVAGRSYTEGLVRFLGDELGMPVVFSSSRPLRPGDMDNELVRQRIHSRAPAFLFGSINEKIYLSEAGARHTNFIPASFPGPTVRRALGTPFMGYSGAVYLVQEIVNRLYETLFNFLPVDGAYAQQRSAGAAGPPKPADSRPGNLPWHPEAKLMLDEALEQLPYIPRISASRELQMKVETMAHERGVSEISPEIVVEVLSQQN
ncbi:MAG: chlorophyllide a reductase subunit Z [Roseiflexaceae bacterium]